MAAVCASTLNALRTNQGSHREISQTDVKHLEWPAQNTDLEPILDELNVSDQPH